MHALGGDNPLEPPPISQEGALGCLRVGELAPHATVICAITCTSTTPNSRPSPSAQGARPAPFPQLPVEQRLRGLWLPPWLACPHHPEASQAGAGEIHGRQNSQNPQCSIPFLTSQKAWAGQGCTRPIHLWCGRALILISFLQADPSEVPASALGTQCPKVWALA